MPTNPHYTLTKIDGELVPSYLKERQRPRNLINTKKLLRMQSLSGVNAFSLENIVALQSHQSILREARGRRGQCSGVMFEMLVREPRGRSHACTLSILVLSGPLRLVLASPHRLHSFSATHPKCSPTHCLCLGPRALCIKRGCIK